MIYFQEIFEFSLYLILSAVFYYYSNSVLRRKHNNILTALTVFIFYVFLFFISEQMQVNRASLSLIINSAAFLICNLILLLTMFECNMKSAVFHCALLLILNLSASFLPEIIIRLAVPITLIPKKHFAVYFFIKISHVLIYSLAAVFSASVITKKITGKNHKNNSFFWFLFIIPLASALVIFALFFISFEASLTRNIKILCAISSVILIFSNILVFFLYEKAVSNASELFELQTMKNKEKTDMEYLEILEQNNNELKIFTHDIKNHIRHMASLTDDPEIISYAHELCGSVSKINRVPYTNNRMLNVILGKYISVCSSKDIKFSLKTLTADLSFLDDTDLTTIITNLMDNAVEAVSSAGSKIIELNLYTKNDFEILKIINTCEAEPETEKDELITTKTDKAMHGLGIKSVKKTLKKYNGIYSRSYNEEQHIFEATVIVPKQKN